MLFQSNFLSLSCLIFLSILKATTGFTFNGFEVRDLYAEDVPTIQNEFAYWNIPALVPGLNYTICNSFPYLGGPGILPGYGSYSQRIYTDLPPHNIIYFAIFMLMMDHWSATDSIGLKFGSNEVHIQNFVSGYSQFGNAACGWTGRYGGSMWLFGRVYHSLPELDFRVINYLNGDSTDRSLAFRGIYLTFANKTAGMTESMCIDTYFSPNTNACSCPKGQYKDSLGACQPCDSHCSWCFGPSASECIACASGSYFDGTTCVTCPLACPICHGTTTDHCDYSCTAGYFLIGNSCLSTCVPPLVFDSLASPQTCTYPCNSDEYLFPDSSCSSTCPSPLVQVTKYTTKKFCESTCGNDYTYFNGYCDSQCPSPFTSVTYQDLKVCNPPVCGPRPCTFCNSNNECLDYHSCVMTSIGKGLCMSYISYSLESTLEKSIINGYTISVNVVPTLDLVDGPNDVLTLEIDNFVQGVDYKASIQRLSKGIYTVTIQITQVMDFDSLLARFTYSPAILNLKSVLTIPHIVYISPELESAAETVKTASVISFGLMVVNTIGFILSGGLATIWSFLPENQYTYYLLYLNVDYLHHTKEYFRSLANYDMLLDIFPDDDQDNDGDDGDDTQSAKELQRSLPIRFVDEEYSPSFQDNAGQVMITLAAIAVAILVVTVLFKLLAIPRRSYLAHRILKILRRIIRWNGIIRQLLAYALAMTLASFIQLYVELFNGHSSMFSTFLAVLAIFIVAIGFKVMASLLEKIPESSFELIVYSEWYGTLWEDLNLDSETTRYYYWIVSLRGVVLSYVAVFFDTFPLVQIITLIIYQCLIVSLFLSKSGIHKVFETTSLNIVSFAEQVLLLAMKVIIMISYIWRQYTHDDDLLILLGWIIIAPGIIIQVIQCVYSTIIQIIDMIKMMKKVTHKIRRFLHKDKIIKKIKRVQIAPRIQQLKQQRHSLNK